MAHSKNTQYVDIPRKGMVIEVFMAFLRLGLTSFGGPIAHLGYFRAEFVERRRWVDDRNYVDLVALCQLLPGPSSSQVGMALGLARAGWPGLLAAWAAFTLPSALALIFFAYGITSFPGVAESGWVYGLKIAAVAIVGQAVWGMAKTSCPDRPRATLAILAALLTTLAPGAAGQLAAILAAGAAGRCFLQAPGPGAVHLPGFAVSGRTGVLALIFFMVLIAGLPVLDWAMKSPITQLLDGVYRAGALVFGGGHVVLPLLESAVVPTGAVDATEFLAGYGAAQAIPGPLFTFAAYLGTVAAWPLQGWLGGVALLCVIFLPGMLLLIAALPFWDGLRRRATIQSTILGINAGVVGILLSALYDPVWTSAIHDNKDFALALACFALLHFGRVQPVLVVLVAGVGGMYL